MSSFRKRSKTYYVRILTGESAKKNHVHLEIASRTIFQSPPKATAKSAEIASLFDKLAGLTLNLNATAEFESSIADLPERGLTRLYSGENKTGDVSMQMTQGSFAITGSPVRRISWTLIGDRRRVSSIIEAEKTVTIGRFYITETLEWLFGLYSLFVLGKTVSV